MELKTEKYNNRNLRKNLLDGLNDSLESIEAMNLRKTEYNLINLNNRDKIRLEKWINTVSETCETRSNIVIIEVPEEEKEMEWKSIWRNNSWKLSKLTQI